MTTAPELDGTGPGEALEADSLYRFFHSDDDEEIQALRGVSLTIRAGEVVAVVGPSGSGKSTLLSCLAGLDEPDGGLVRIAGTRITRRSEPERARLRSRFIGVLTQNDNLLAQLSVAQNIALSRRLAGRSPREGVDQLLDSLGIAHRASAGTGTLSGGEAVRAGLALALANDPKVLLADEPTGDLDGATERQVLELVLARAGAGMAVLIASHSSEVAAAADRVVVLDNGSIV